MKMEIFKSKLFFILKRYFFIPSKTISFPEIVFLLLKCFSCLANFFHTLIQKFHNLWKRFRYEKRLNRIFLDNKWFFIPLWVDFITLWVWKTRLFFSDVVRNAVGTRDGTNPRTRCSQTSQLPISLHPSMAPILDAKRPRWATKTSALNYCGRRKHPNCSARRNGAISWTKRILHLNLTKLLT